MCKVVPPAPRIGRRQKMRTSDFTRLYSEHAPSVYSFLSYRTGDRVLAEDLLADTFERALRARRRYDPRRAGERTWLYAIALNCVRDHARRVAAESRALARTPDPTLVTDGAFDALENREALHEALAKLNDQEREVVALRFGADLTLAEIAAVIDEPRSKVEARIYRGLRKLRNRMTAEV
jgi:RNA polymerase sigma factor (sigma-70 family)